MRCRATWAFQNRFRDLSCFRCLRPRGCVNRRQRSIRRTLLGWSRLFHLGSDAWCLRISVVDLHSIRPMASVPVRRPFLRPTSPLVGAGCRVSTAATHCCAGRLRHTFLGFHSPSMLTRTGYYPSRVPPRNFARWFQFGPSLDLSTKLSDVATLTGPFLNQFGSAARPGFVGCPHALFAPRLHTCRAYPIPTASLGFLPSED